MTSTTALRSSLVAETLQSLNDGSLRTLSRSPHPYHRRSSSLQNATRVIAEAQPKYSDTSESTESEERGTEADDEKGPILKALPAPPLRGRKGLRGSKTPADQTPAISPFPTPPALNEQRPSYFAGDKTRKGSKLDTTERERAIEAYQKYVKRRRAEIARRCTEGILLALIGTAACRSTWQAGRFQGLLPALINGFATVAFLYAIFPIRIALQRFHNGDGFSTAVRTGFHIPSRFDPGPLMYPVFFPFFISASLNPKRSTVMTTNIVLGISSIPSKVVYTRPLRSFGYVHWALSVIPILNGTLFSTSSSSKWSHIPKAEAEQLLLLYPLHQATLVTLKYLTATSLDPAEIQLLSTGLINLYLFAASPQAEILKALLWIGALCLFIFCQKALSLEVRIARIPSWKFARNKSPRKGLLSIAENVANMFLPHHRYRTALNSASDDEDYEHLKSARKMVRNRLRLRKARTGGIQSDLDTILDEKDRDSSQADKQGLQRSLTLSPNGQYPHLFFRRRNNSLTTTNSGLLSLTYTQAQACKWLISFYTFSAVAIIILVVVRHYVSVHALSSYEPFGWAIGYLFGNIQPLRFWVVSNNFNTWIKLPGHVMNTVVHDGCGWIEQTRQMQLGPANMRLAIAGYCIAVLTCGIGAVLHLGTIVEVDTRRKVFHGIMVAMLLPTIFIDPCFIALALGLILAIFLLLDLFRASQLPPISKPLTTFLAPYVDGRDYRGPVIVSHIFLLIGCAIPLWLSLAGVSRTNIDPWVGWDTNIRDLSMISGVVCVGMGDAAASLIGRRYGKTKWFWGGGKSIEGSVAFALAVTVGLAASYIWLRIGGWMVWDTRAFFLALLKMVVAGSGASVLESVLTAGNDNVIVPIGLWLLTRGLCI